MSGAPTPSRRDIRDTIDWIKARRLHVVLGAVFVLAIGLQQNFSHLSASQFHPDESRWLNRAHYTKDLLHPFSSVWEDRYLIRGQPPGGSYITGIGLLMQGRDLDTNGAWDFRYGSESVTWWNTSRGNMPSWDDLRAARRTSAFLGAISALAVFLIVTQISNVAGGITAGVFFAVHPLSVYLSTIAVSDAAFTCLVALTTLSGMALARKPAWGRTVVLGLLLGAGAATKLSPIFIAIGLAGMGFVFVADPLLRRVPPVRWLLDRAPGMDSPKRASLGWKLISLPLIAALTFVLTYPYLWPAPIARTRNLFEFRKAEMENQARIWPDSAVTSRLDALDRTWQTLEHRYSATSRLFGDLFATFGRDLSSGGFDLPIAFVGLIVLLVLTWNRGVVSPSFFAVVLSGAQSALILGGMQIDFDRYYLPIVFAFAIGVGVSASGLWWLAVRVITRGTWPVRRHVFSNNQSLKQVPSR